MRRFLLCGWLILAIPLCAQDDGSDNKVKAGIKSSGKAVGHAFVEVGHGFKNGAKAVGHTVKEGSKRVAQGVKEGGHDVGQGFKRAFGKGGGAEGKGEATAKPRTKAKPQNAQED